MNGEISLAIALTLYGNAFLRGQNTRIDVSNSNFQYCKSVMFIQPNNDQEIIYAPDYNIWFARIKDDGVVALRLGSRNVFSNTVKMAREDFFIEAIRGNNSDVWQMQFLLGNQNDPENRIWHVKFTQIASNQTTILPSPNKNRIAKTKHSLMKILVEISAFAYKQNLAGFANIFDSAVTALDSADPWSYVLYYKDMLPANLLCLEARQLLAGASIAWVFGGMGSWNDLTFEFENKEYLRLSSELYNILLESFYVAVNSSALLVT